jgi:hypothetical protein
MILCAVVLFLAGIFVWGVFGQLDTTIAVGAVTTNDQTICYIKETDLDSLDTGMQVMIGEETYQISNISRQPILVDNTFAQYLLHVGGISEGEWVYIAALDDVYGENGMITEAKIIIESIEPIRCVLN